MFNKLANWYNDLGKDTEPNKLSPEEITQILKTEWTIPFDCHGRDATPPDTLGIDHLIEGLPQNQNGATHMGNGQTGTEVRIRFSQPQVPNDANNE